MLKIKELEGNGSYDSPECLELLKEADVVVTNPPFSLFREYIKTVLDFGKDFLVIGSKLAIIYRDFFPLVKENKVKLGYTHPNNFITPSGTTKNINGLCRWFTTLPVNRTERPLILTKSYSPDKYPKYDNYDAIEVSRTSDIPYDYNGVMGVPISFLDKCNPNQFEIIWQASGNSYANAPKEILESLKFNPEIKYGGGLGSCVLNGKARYTRLFIKKKGPRLPA